MDDRCDCTGECLAFACLHFGELAIGQYHCGFELPVIDGDQERPTDGFDSERKSMNRGKIGLFSCESCVISQIDIAKPHQLIGQGSGVANGLGNIE
jgi:hypothetical protein